jgi:hypothetical protein
MKRYADRIVYQDAPAREVVCFCGKIMTLDLETQDRLFHRSYYSCRSGSERCYGTMIIREGVKQNASNETEKGKNEADIRGHNADGS